MSYEWKEGYEYNGISPQTIQTLMITMFDATYPVGSYYETSDTSFNPNNEFVGTWELETEGLVHVSAGTNYVVSSNAQDGGEATHTLTEEEMPLHRHTQRKVVNNGGQATIINDTVTGTYSGDVLASTKQISWYSNKAAVSTHEAGRDQPHNNMQPYKIVNRWHRVA